MTLPLAVALPTHAEQAAIEQPTEIMEPNPGIEEVVVFGRAANLLGQAAAAREGTVGGADLLRPMLRTAELFEAAPGMVAVQHSGSGKANQYFLRGFNLDHGTDFTTYVDGMPWNMHSHGHGQGYLDVNGLCRRPSIASTTARGRTVPTLGISPWLGRRSSQPWTVSNARLSRSNQACLVGAA